MFYIPWEEQNLLLSLVEDHTIGSTERKTLRRSKEYDHVFFLMYNCFLNCKVFPQVKISFYRFRWHSSFRFKVGLSSFKKSCFIRLNESPLKVMKNTFPFMLKALFVLEIFKSLSWRFGLVEKTSWIER